MSYNSDMNRVDVDDEYFLAGGRYLVEKRRPYIREDLGRMSLMPEAVLVDMIRDARREYAARSAKEQNGNGK